MKERDFIWIKGSNLVSSGRLTRLNVTAFGIGIAGVPFIVIAFLVSLYSPEGTDPNIKNVFISIGILAFCLMFLLMIWNDIQVSKKVAAFSLNGCENSVLLNEILGSLMVYWKAEYSMRLSKSDPNTGTLLVRTLYSTQDELDGLLSDLKSKGISVVPTNL